MITAIVRSRRHKEHGSGRRRWWMVLPSSRALPYSSTQARRLPRKAPVTLDQHWQLLAESVSGLTIATSTQSCPIVRGVLPGGTTKFDPGPTASLVVVGKATGGSGLRVAERQSRSPNSDDLAEVDFYPADSSFTLRSAVIDWPATDMGLDHLSVHGVGANAGSLSIQKAGRRLRVRASGATPE